MKKVNVLLVLFVGLFFLPLAGQTLLEDARALNDLLTNETNQVSDLTFEILEKPTKLLPKGFSYPPDYYDLKEGDSIKINVNDSLIANWLFRGDSLFLLESSKGLWFNRTTFKVDSSDIKAKSVSFIVNNSVGVFSLAYENPSLSEDEFFGK